MSRAPLGPRLRPIIRLFVSSTFSDLKQERDALQKRVFPILEQLCLRAGFQFQAIDLRWGVSTEAGLDHRTMRICFEELRRSQDVSPEPNFLILLGNRYGWRPLPEEISAEEFQALAATADQIIAVPNQLSAGDVLRRWYQLDQNALTPMYLFMPRRKPASDDPDQNDYTEPNVWRGVELVLWQIINRAFPPSTLPGRFATLTASTDPLPPVVRFQASATEQEIWSGALRVPHAHEHVFAFFRDAEPPPGIDIPLLRDYFDVVNDQLDPVAQTAQRDLKAAIQQRLGGNVKVLPRAQLMESMNSAGKTVVRVSTEHILEFCREVQERLTAVIERQVQDYWRGTRSTQNDSAAIPSPDRTARELEIERDEHARFGRERGAPELFVGRQEQRDRIRDYLDGNSTWPLVVHGASGCGKTALLARAVADVPATKQAVVRYIGVSPRSSDLRGLLRSLCEELRLQHPLVEPLPSDVRELIEEFRRHLQAATAQQPVVVFLDALDQLAEADNARQLFWIPFGPLPSHVKLVVSCLADRDENDPVGQPYVAFQRRKLPAENLVNLDALSLDDAKTLLFHRWLPAAGRTLTPSQTRLVEQRMTADPCRQPLYLKLLLEELKLWRSYDTGRQLTEPASSSTYISALLQQLFDRLSEEVNHGELLVQRALGYLAAARRGLSEAEMLGVLFADRDFRRSIVQKSIENKHRLSRRPKRIPIAIWSRLRSDLAPYLTERSAPGGSVLTLYHRQVAEWVHARYVERADWTPHGTDESDKSPHARLARFFARQDYFLESLDEQRARARKLPPTPRPVNIRKVDELPSQLLEVGKRFGQEDEKSPHWDAIADLFTDLHFLEAKAEAAE